MKKYFALLMVLSMVFCMLAGCAAVDDGAAADSANKDDERVDPVSADFSTDDTQDSDKPLAGKTIAFINCGPDDFYAAYNDMLKVLVEDAGGVYEYAQSEYDAQTELNNVNDMIVKGVDAIGLMAVSSVTSANAVKTAADAGIPVFLLGIAVEGCDQYVAYTGFDYYGYGQAIGQYAVENYPDAKMITIDGILTQDVSIQFRDGFMDTVEQAGLERPVSLGDGGWSKEGALNLMQDMIVSGREFDLVFCANEEEVAGAVQALDEAGITDKIILSINGKEQGVELIKAGKLEVSISNAPTLLSDLAFQQMLAYLTGEDFPAEVNVSNPGYITADDQSAFIPWEAEAYAQYKTTDTKGITDINSYVD